MAKEIIKVIKSWDDLELAINGRKIEAAPEVIKVGYNGKWYELDLCESNITDLEAVLEPYLKHGRAAKAHKSKKAAGNHYPPPPLSAARTPLELEGPPAPPGVTVPPRVPGSRSPERVEFFKGMREFAKSRNIALKTKGYNGYYYPPSLQADYIAFLREQQKQHSDVA